MARGFSKRPINSVKNIVDSTLLGVSAGTRSSIIVANAVNDYTGGVTDVPTGAVIKSVYLFVQILPTLGTANVDWYFTKRPGLAASIAPILPGLTGGAPERKWIMHEEKGIPGNAGDGAYPLTFKGVINIPRGRQRMGEDDDLIVVTTGVDIHNVCVKCIYKWYT